MKTKLKLGSDNRVEISSKDPLFIDYTVVVDDSELPSNSSDNLGEYLYIEGEFVHSPIPAVGESTLIPVTITAVDYAVQTSSDFTKISVNALPDSTNVELLDKPLAVVHGTVEIPDQSFIAPICMVNTVTQETKVLYKKIDVKDGLFAFELNLPAGKYVISTSLLNSELPVPTFEIKETAIYAVI